MAAKRALADVPLAHILATPVIDPGTDDVSRLILDSHDAAAFAPVRTLTVRLAILGQLGELVGNP